MRSPVLFLFCALLLQCERQQPASPPLDPDDALATFALAEGFQIEAFAAEPLVADPVSMEIDEKGRVWVVEMHGYPLDTSGSGVIKQLMDRDGDGWPDEAQVFADGLILPTGIMAWKEGVIVTDAPDVLYLEDTDGDGRADRREVLLTGFARSNPQHNLNTPRFELDNWIYLAHEGTIGTKFYHDEFGDEGSAIHYPGHPDGPHLPRNAAGRNVRFQPWTQGLEMLSGETQFGYSFGPRGHMLNGSNYYYLFHEVLAARYLERNPYLQVDDPTHNLPAGGGGTTVYPITRDPQHQLLTDAGVITSGCGVTWYQGGLFPAPYDRVAFVAEPVHNLVHTDILEDRGATYAARPQFKEREWLASTDSWFRPVNFYVGPDGALYVIDYYRQIVEHPEWMSEEINASGALYNGDGKGRIYRVSPTGTAPPDFVGRLDLGARSPAELAGYLASANRWWRRQAQRLLVAGQVGAAIPHLRSLLEASPSAVGRTHALWALQGLRGLTENDLRQALADPDPGVRENAIRVAELQLEDWPGLVPALHPLAEDADAKVRFQALLTLGGRGDAASRRACRAVLRRDLADPWVHRAALSSPWIHDLDLDDLLAGAGGQEGLADFVAAFAELLGRRGHPEEVNATVASALRRATADPAVSAALLEGLGRGMAGSEAPVAARTQERLGRLFSAEASPELRRAALHFLDQTGYFDQDRPALARRAEALAFDPAQALPLRQDAVRVLAWTRREAGADALWPLLETGVEGELQLAVLDAMRPLADPALCERLLERWPSLTPRVRARAADLFMRGSEERLLLLAAVERGQVSQEQIGWRRSVSLLNAGDDAVRARARLVLEGNQSARTTPGEDYQAILALNGRAERGQPVFDRACATCHQLNGAGGLALGPDLAAVRNRTPRAILRDILEPNAAIADGYEHWTVERRDGGRADGIMVAESAGAITLRNLAGEDVRIPRSAIASLEAQPYSLMPEGMAAQLDDQELADLLAMLSGRLQ